MTRTGTNPMDAFFQSIFGGPQTVLCDAKVAAAARQIKDERFREACDELGAVEATISFGLVLTKELVSTAFVLPGIDEIFTTEESARQKRTNG